MRRVRVNFWRGAENCVIDVLELTVQGSKEPLQGSGRDVERP